MASLVDSLLADPNFQSASPPVQQRALFRAGSPDERQAFLNTVDQQYGLPTGTLHGIATVESGVNPDVQDGKAGERGMFQFMPETGAQYGLTPENFTDPLEQVRAAGKFMQANMAQSGGNLATALGLYNGDKTGAYANKVMDAMGVPPAPGALGAIGQTVKATVGRLGPGAQAFSDLMAGTPPPDVSWRDPARALGFAAQASSPSMLTGGAGFETLKRLQRGTTEDEADQANARGQLITGGALLAPNMLAGAARLASPTLRTALSDAETLGTRRVANMGAAIGEAGKAGEAVATTPGVQTAARTIEKQAGSISAATGRFQPVRVLGRFQASPLDPKALGKLRSLGGQAVATAQRLAGDPNLVQGLLAYATPQQAALIQRAITAGQPLASLPFTAQELEMVGQAAKAGSGLFSTVAKELGMDAVLALGGYHAGGFKAAAGALVGRAALKGLDILIGSPTGQTAYQGARSLSQSGPAAARLIGAGVASQTQPAPRATPTAP